ncbi:unnamed protein product [Penicillium salamii]|uniref:Actin-like protein ARP6 n=1 Tax=Penicillium salamii TaxID=1612424 RepID=A0A9W4JN27_9EURO|nr:unnamed protein product [Penicillium salamii]CAG8122109.1 unnamed protein product [Penicillium salamii]CAG8133014.1 unnamed protein product [Penicillium salamii]CAG8157069.1 unnamed protein product [Penicillium salamii]CAG8186419.1 unnamed protein product [Penicillium salamii]
MAPRAARNIFEEMTYKIPDKTFIIDNGAYTMKAGYASADCNVIPNAIVKTRDNDIVVGSELSTVLNWNEAVFRRPMEKGFITSWETQREIWDRSFFDATADAEVKIEDARDTTLILTEAPNAMLVLQRNTDEMVMEEWGFGGYMKAIGPTFNAWNEIQSLFGDPLTQSQEIKPADCVLVVDSSFSHTTVTPVYRGHPMQRGIRRLDFGGKHITSLLKELVSERQINMMDETYIMNEIKESVCYVSNDFNKDMERTVKERNRGNQGKAEDGIVLDYVLPDPNANRQGFTRQHDPEMHKRKKRGALSGLSAETLSEDVLVMGSERFHAPELLFTPSDIGVREPGIPEMIHQSLSVFPPGVQAAYWANILVVGGNSLLRGFMERLETDLRAIAPDTCVLRLRRAQHPIESAWLGASRLAQNREHLKRVSISREEYLENGSGWAVRRFTGIQA